MVKIADQYLKAKSRAESLGTEKLFTRAHRDLLEWLVLGAVCELLEQNGRDHPEYAVKREAPDFITYEGDRATEWAPVEITEAMRPGRQRNRELLTMPAAFHIAPVPRPLASPFDTLREVLHAKMQKPYAERCGLLVYFNIGALDLSYEENPFVGMIQDEAEIRPFVDAVSFKRVFVLDASMRHVVELPRA